MTLKEDVTHARERWKAITKELRDTRAELEKIRKEIKESKPGGDRRAKLRKEQAILNRQRKALAEAQARRDKVRDELVQELHKRQDEKEDFGTKPGSPDWGGSAHVIDDLVAPVYERHGIPKTSRKRPANHPLSIANPSSDHSEANVMADALDGGVVNAYAIGDEIGNAVGVGSVDDYVIENFVYKGVSFRIQVIAGTHGTGPHLHCGVRRT